MSSRQPKDYGIDNHSAFMDEYRFTLSHILNVEEAFPWLRHNGVIDKSDEERIMNTYRTSPERAGALMDTLLRRGKRGINAFLEHIEYEHVDTYKLITRRNPQPPGKDYKRPKSVRRKTIDHLQQITETLMKGMETLAKSQQHIAGAVLRQQKLNPLEGGFQALDEELHMKNMQINNLTQKILEDKDLIRLLQAQCEQHKEEKNMAADECEELRKVKDKYQAECNNLRSEKEKYGELTRYELRQVSLRQQNRSNQDVSSNRPLSKETDNTNSELKALYSKVTELSQVKAKLQEETEDAAKEIATLQADITTYKEHNKIFSNQIQDMQQERDKALQQLEQCRKKCEELQKINVALKKDYSDANSYLRNIQSEYSYRPRLKPVQAHTCSKCGQSNQLSKREGLQVFNEFFKSFECDEDGGYSMIDDRKDMIQECPESDDEDPPEVHPRELSTATGLVKQRK